MIDRILKLPFAPLLMTIALSNTALAAVLLLALYNDGTRDLTVGFNR